MPSYRWIILLFATLVQVGASILQQAPAALGPLLTRGHPLPVLPRVCRVQTTDLEVSDNLRAQRVLHHPVRFDVATSLVSGRR
jgi:hypothetical protein